MSGAATIAAVTRFGEPLELLEVERPDPEPGALVVEMECATICGSDVHHWEGEYAEVFGTEPPLCSGHEGVGRVLEIGAGAELDSIGQPLEAGDRVVWEHAPCGHCYECRVLHDPVLCTNRTTGLWRKTTEFPHISATFGTHSYVWPNAGRLKVPDGVRSEWASGASCAMRTVIAGIEKLGGIEPTETVAVQGVGPLGLFAVALLSLRSPRRLIAIGAPDDRLEVARQWGATETISIADHPTQEARREALLELTDGRGADVVCEFAGVPGAVAETFDLAARGGRCLVIGTAAGDPQPIVAHQITLKQLTVHGSFSGRIDHYWKAFQLMERYADRFDWGLLLSRRYRLDQITEALESMKRGEEIKPVILTGERG